MVFRRGQHKGREIMKALWCGAILMAAGMLWGGEVLIDAGTVDDFAANPELATDDDGSFIPAPRQTYITRDGIKIDYKKKYRLSFEYKNGSGNTGSATAAVVAIPYNAKGRRIHGGNIAHVNGTEAAMIGELAKGGDEITIKPTKAWLAAMKRKRSYAVAFGARKDCKDLPNFNLLNIKSMRLDDEGNLIIKFTTKSKRAWPAGTMIRLHQHGMNGVGKTAKGTDEWQTMSFEIQGGSNQAASNKWWRGTKTVKLGIYGDSRNGANKILIRKLKLEEVD